MRTRGYFRILGVFACVLGLSVYYFGRNESKDVLPIKLSASSLIISEYIEGTSNNKALEIYNDTGASVDLAAIQAVVSVYANGATTASANINLTGTIPNGDVFVLANTSANAAILTVADQTSGALTFNGDDAVVLRVGGTGGTVVDSLGQVGVDPGTEWGTGLTSTADNTIVRKPTVCGGDAVINDAFDPATQFDGFAVDTFSNLGTHTATCTTTASPVTVGGRVMTPTGRGVSGAIVYMSGQNGITRIGRTNQMGYYSFEEVEVGSTYILDVTSKRYIFGTQVLFVTEDGVQLDFTASGLR